jgi:HSP20 family molecular chaperone IbpA
MDVGVLLDEIFKTAQNFSEEFHRNAETFSEGFCNNGYEHRQENEYNADYYPNYFYPPMNVFVTETRDLIFEFALAGFDEKDINLSFQGDYMIFSAKVSEEKATGNVRYLKRRLKRKDIEKQKYFVPQDKYDQDSVKAIYRNGILKVTVPPKESPDQNDGIKIEIVREGN